MNFALSEETALSVESVSIAYGRKIVITNVGLEVMHGETYGLIGLNGAGKTTLIKSILGLRDCNGGRILIEGRERNRPESKRRIAYLPERFEPPWFLSGIEFLHFSVRLYGQTRTQDQIFAMSRRLALDPEVLKNRVQTYSKGMRQKLGLLATLLTGCPLLILDEPMSGLDPRARTMVKDLLNEAREEGRTVFLSSHILADMNEICDRVAVLHDGVLVFTGTPAALRAEGKNDNLERAFLQVIDTRAA